MFIIIVNHKDNNKTKFAFKLDNKNYKKRF